MRTDFKLAIFLLGVAGHSPLARAQSAGTFSPTASMSTARSLHTATLLLDGRVLIPAEEMIPAPPLPFPGPKSTIPYGKRSHRPES